MSNFTSALLDWFAENGRDLPWRQTRDPYAVWLSEIILQQTQVKQGWDYWQRFIHRWPTVEQLAAATEDEVLREWQGLGYYSRARNLHFAARQIVDLGHFPNTFEEIRQLKGVGDYTAAAIGSIAFGLPVAVVDGNVFRVLSRHYGIATPINTTAGKKEFTLLAQSLLPTDSSTYNQAIMDFGAIQCTPKSPCCQQCPLQESCVALCEGRVAELPVKTGKLKTMERWLSYIYIRYNGQTAIHRRGAGDIWQGLWEPLLIEQKDKKTEVRDVIAALNDMKGTEKQLTAVNGIANGQLSINGKNNNQLTLLRSGMRHVLTHRLIIADFYLWQPKERPILPDGYIWIDEADIDNYGVPRLVEIMLEMTC